MDTNQLVFDKHKEMHITPEGAQTEICLTISDALCAWEEELTEEYKQKIVDFINSLPVWHKKASEAVCVRGTQVYNASPKQIDIKLMNIFVLFEQAAPPLFGLGFRISFDIEHGCGMKITGDTFEILEIGGGDVAFC